MKNDFDNIANKYMKMLVKENADVDRVLSQRENQSPPDNGPTADEVYDDEQVEEFYKDIQEVDELINDINRVVVHMENEVRLTANKLDSEQRETFAVMLDKAAAKLTGDDTGEGGLLARIAKLQKAIY